MYYNKTFINTLLCDRPSFHCVWFTCFVVRLLGGSFAIFGLCGWFERIANVPPKVYAIML